LACGPTPLLLLVGRAMESLVVGVVDEAVNAVVGEAVVGLNAQE